MDNNQKSDIAVIGLAVMGQNLILNMSDNGFKITAYNRTTSKVDEFIKNEAKEANVVGAHSLEELVASLKTPRRVMLMIKAGEAVDKEIERLIPLLDKGDIIIDGGNSLYSDTIRRNDYVRSKELYYIGTGVSERQKKALGVALLLVPGGSPEAWPAVKDIFQKISAKVDDGTPCCDWVGQGGAGHYVKMVHNGIEYGDMQLICEAYDLLKKYAGLSNK
jgi:6-phosphogluconate dehydrogenase